MVAARSSATARLSVTAARPATMTAAVRFYSKDSKDSLLSDDILAKAGIDSSSKAESSNSTSNTSSQTKDPESDSSPHTSEEQRQHWKDTAKRASNKTTTDLKREKHSNYFYLASLGALVGGSIYLTRDWDDAEEELKHKDVPNGYSADLCWARFKTRLGGVFGFFNEPVFDKLLPDPLPAPYTPPLTLVLGLDDVLVHSEWSRQYGWRTAKRPGLDYFLGYLSQYYEIVLFSSNYMINSEKVVEGIDKYKAYITYRLYREGTTYRNGKIIKDLSLLNRDLGKVIMIDCREDSYALQPENAIPLKPWEGNADDKELIKLIPFLEWLATQPIKDVRPILKSFEDKYIPDEYQRRESIVRKKFEDEWYAEQAKRQKNDWASAFLGIKPPTQAAPMMPQDYIRQEAQKRYEFIQNELAEKGEKMLADEKAYEQKMLSEQRFTLNKLVTEGLPKPEEIQAAALAAEQKIKEEQKQQGQK